MRGTLCDGTVGGNVRVGRRGLDGVPRIGLVDAAGVQQQLLGNGRQRHIRCVAAAQPFHQVDGAVHIAARGQRLRRPLLVMPVRLGVEREHSQQIIEPAGVKQRAVASVPDRCRRRRLPAVGHDVLNERQKLVRPVRSQCRIRTQGAPMLVQGFDIGWIVVLDGVEKALEPLFAQARWHWRGGDQGHHLLDNTGGRVAQRAAGAVDAAPAGESFSSNRPRPHRPTPGRRGPCARSRRRPRSGAR